MRTREVISLAAFTTLGSVEKWSFFSWREGKNMYANTHAYTMSISVYASVWSTQKRMMYTRTGENLKSVNTKLPGRISYVCLMWRLSSLILCDEGYWNSDRVRMQRLSLFRQIIIQGVAVGGGWNNSSRNCPNVLEATQFLLERQSNGGIYILALPTLTWTPLTAAVSVTLESNAQSHCSCTQVLCFVHPWTYTRNKRKIWGQKYCCDVYTRGKNKKWLLHFSIEKLPGLFDR